MSIRRVCFVSQTTQLQRPLLDGSTRYRCYHPAEGLAAVGIACVVTTLESFLEDPSLDFDLYVFHRPTMRLPRFGAVLNSLRRAGKRLVADYDDLIFGSAELAVASSIFKNGHRSEPEAVDSFVSNLKAMQAFDVVTTSTMPLAERVREFHPTARVTVVPNVMSQRAIELHDGLGSRVGDPASNLIGYFSGTHSHDLDFTIAAEPMLTVLAEEPTLHFLVVGPVLLCEELARHPRVVRHEVVDDGRCSS